MKGCNHKRTLGKHVILIITCYVCVMHGFSQKSNFSGGFSFGNTFSGISADNIPGYWKTGITTGLFGFVKVVDNPNVRMLVQMDMNFTMKGTRTKPKFSAIGYERKDKFVVSLGYIEFPILVRLRFNSIKTDNDGLWLDFGPTIGFLLYQQTHFHSHVNTGAGTGGYGFAWDDLHILKKFDFSLMTGLSYVFKRHHGLSLRFSHSLIPIGTPEVEVTTGLLKKYYNSTFYFVYSFQF